MYERYYSATLLQGFFLYIFLQRWEVQRKASFVFASRTVQQFFPLIWNGTFIRYQILISIAWSISRVVFLCFDIKLRHISFASISLRDCPFPEYFSSIIGTVCQFVWRQFWNYNLERMNLKINSRRIESFFITSQPYAFFLTSQPYAPVFILTDISNPL